MDYATAKREVQKQALYSGGITVINGQKLEVGPNGKYCLDGAEIVDYEKALWPYVEVDEGAVQKYLEFAQAIE